MNYQKLFEYMSKEHSVILLEQDMQEICKIVNEMQKETLKLYTEEDIQKTWNAAYIDALRIDEMDYKPLFYEDFLKQLKSK